MIDITLAIPVIVALVEGVKGLGLESKYAFLVSSALGVVGFYFLGDGEVGPRLFEGLVAGLSASGLYSGVTKMVRS